MTLCVLPGTHHDLVEALVFTRPGQVDLNIINGRVIVQDGSILTVDVPVSAAKRLTAIFSALCKRNRTTTILLCTHVTSEVLCYNAIMADVQFLLM